MINPELKVGDKVVLLTMEGEPDMSYGEKVRYYKLLLFLDTNNIE